MQTGGKGPEYNPPTVEQKKEKRGHSSRISAPCSLCRTGRIYRAELTGSTLFSRKIRYSAICPAKRVSALPARRKPSER